MKATVVAQVSVNANRQAVFSYLSHLKYHYLWNPPLRRISPVVPLKLGTEYSSLSAVLGKEIQAHNVVTIFRPDREVEIENTTGLLLYSINFLLRTRAQQTLIVCTTTVSSDSPAFAFATPVLEMLAKRELRTDLEALKIAVENKLDVAP